MVYFDSTSFNYNQPSISFVESFVEDVISRQYLVENNSIIIYYDKEYNYKYIKCTLRNNNIEIAIPTVKLIKMQIFHIVLWI